MVRFLLVAVVSIAGKVKAINNGRMPTVIIAAAVQNALGLLAPKNTIMSGPRI